MSTVWLILLVVLTLLISFIAFNLLNIFFLSRLRVNRWIILSIAVILLLLLLFIQPSGFLFLLYIGLVFMVFLWFAFTRNNMPKPEMKKEVKIRPKAKPNRVKNKK